MHGPSRVLGEKAQPYMSCACWQGELAAKEVELAAASAEAESLLRDISDSTALAELEKAKVAVIVDDVSKTARVRAAWAPAQGLCAACLLASLLTMLWSACVHTWIMCRRWYGFCYGSASTCDPSALKLHIA